MIYNFVCTQLSSSGYAHAAAIGKGWRVGRQHFDATSDGRYCSGFRCIANRNQTNGVQPYHAVQLRAIARNVVS